MRWRKDASTRRTSHRRRAGRVTFPRSTVYRLPSTIYLQPTAVRIPTHQLPAIDDALRARLKDLCTDGWAFFERFDREVREKEFHSFIASEYEVVLEALIAQRAPGLTFLELGSASGVITIMADLLGYDASGIEIDTSLVSTARKLAAKFDSRARFVAGSFFPAGHTFRTKEGDGRTGTMSAGVSAYLELGRALDDFDVVFGYPWGGEEPVMLDLMKRYGNPESLLLLHGVNDGVKGYRGGKQVFGKR